LTDAAQETGEPVPATEPVAFEPFDREPPVLEPENAGAVAVVSEEPDPPAPEALVEDDEVAPAQVLTDDPIVTALDRFEDRLSEGQRLLSRQTDIAAALHAENLRLKEGELRRAQQPLVRDVLRVHDDVAQMLESLPHDGDAHRDLEIVKATLADVLARNGLEQAVCEPGEAFDPRAHKVVDVRPTDDETVNRTIAEVIRPAFTWDDGEPIRVAQVAVFKYRPPEAEPAESKPADDAAG
jgi:molecular chaperone GrpE (heat shock protein)